MVEDGDDLGTLSVVFLVVVAPFLSSSLFVCVIDSCLYFVRQFSCEHSYVTTKSQRIH